MTLRRIARTFALGATLVWLAAACSPRGGEGTGKGPGAERADAKGTPGRGAGDTAGPGYVYRDSADVFDPDGFYSPVDTIRLGGYLLKPLELHTVDYYYEGNVHHDRPRVLVPPRAELGLTIPGREGLASSACLNPMISPDTVSLRCTGTPVGDVTIEGHFLVQARTFWDSPYNDDATPVLRALVVVSRDGREIHHAVHTFTFTSGD